MQILKARPSRWHDLSSPYVCQIHTKGTPGERFFLNEEGGGEGGGGGGSEPPKTLTEAEAQARFDKAANSIREEVKKQYKDYDKLKEQSGKVPDLIKQIEDLKIQIGDVNKTAEEKQRDAAARAAKQIETERAELELGKSEAEKDRDKWKNLHFESQAITSLGAALDTAKVTREDRADALTLFRAGLTKINHDEDGRVVSVIYEGVEHAKLEDAAAAFLKTRPRMIAVAKPPVGGGTKTPNASGAPGGALKDMTPEQAFATARNRTK